MKYLITKDNIKSMTIIFGKKNATIVDYETGDVTKNYPRSDAWDMLVTCRNLEYGIMKVA